jgi:UDP-glucose 4-epimerase
MKYILVSGGLGFIGSHTVIELLMNNYNVIIIDNLINSSIDIFHKIIKITNLDDKLRLKFYNIDIRNELQLENLFVNHKIDSVIHFASLKAVSESIKKPLLYYYNNISGTIILLQVMKKYNCKKIIFSSSATVYGNNNYPVNEESKIGDGITNPYGKTKYMLENILQDLYQSDNSWSIVILRYFNPIGAHPSGIIGENPNDTPNNLFPYLLKVSVGQLDQLCIFGNDYDTNDGTCIRDFIHVVDLAKGHILSLHKISTNSSFIYGKKINNLHIYNLGTGKGTSILELINTFENVNSISLKYKFVQRREGDLSIVYANTEKAYKELGWTCQYTIEDMCRHGYNFIKNYNNIKNVDI